MHIPAAARISTNPPGGRITTAVLRGATHRGEVVTQLGKEQLRGQDLRGRWRVRWLLHFECCTR